MPDTVYQPADNSAQTKSVSDDFLAAMMADVNLLIKTVSTAS